MPQHLHSSLTRRERQIMDVLFRRGDSGDACFLVRHGLIKSSILSARGEAVKPTFPR